MLEKSAIIHKSLLTFLIYIRLSTIKSGGVGLSGTTQQQQ